jgi:hypothetical protein
MCQAFYRGLLTSLSTSSKYLVSTYLKYFLRGVSTRRSRGASYTHIRNCIRMLDIFRFDGSQIGVVSWSGAAQVSQHISIRVKDMYNPNACLRQ